MVRVEKALVRVEKALPLPAGLVLNVVLAGGCDVDVQKTLVAASVASLDSVAVHLETCFKSG
jgi:hypothetical protein